MGATSGRNTKRRNADQVSHPVNSAATVFAGCMISLLNTGGKAVPSGTALSGSAVGVAERTVTGVADGSEVVTARRGCFQFANSASTDLIARADIGHPCYIVDDQTVAKTDNSATRAVAGMIVDVDSQGVWVDVGSYSISITNEAA